MATDWAGVRLAYVHGTDTMRELADKHGIKAAGLMRRAAKEGWDSQRKQESAKVISAAGASLGNERASRLAKFNEQDIKIAEALKARAVELLRGDVDDRTLANLRGVFEGAQRIGRLSLGAETEMSVIKTQELPSSIDEFV